MSDTPSDSPRPTRGPSRTVLLAMAALGFVLLVFATISISLPDKEIRVVSFEPQRTADLTTNVTIKFSKPMVPKEALDQPVLEPPVKFDPAIPGLARWVEVDVLRFFPETSLRPATDYTARVESDKTWVSGLQIVNKDIYRFRTPLLQITGTNAWTEVEYNTPGWVRIQARLKFNFEISQDEIKNHMKIIGESGADKSSVPFSVRAVDEYGNYDSYGDPAYHTTAPGGVFSQQFVILTEAVEQLKSEQHYLLTIDKGMSCRDCGYALAEPIKIPILVEAKRRPVIQRVSSPEGDGQSTIEIGMSMPMLLDNAADFITLSPAIDFIVDARGAELTLRGAFKPGEMYMVSIAKGMLSQIGTELETAYSSNIRIADLRPSVQFSSSGMFLPKDGNGLLEIKTVNIKAVEVQVEQIFPNNLIYFLTTGYGGYDYWDNRQSLLGRSLFIKEQDIELVQNELQPATIDIKALAGDSARGIFKVSARSKNERWTGDSRYVMLTDLGISARFSDNYLMVWVNSLTSTQPVAGVAVSLISKNNQVIVTGKTDGRGIAVFKDIGDKLKGWEPFVITAEKSGDLAYLRLDETQMPITDFDVDGRPYLATGYEAFVYPDRGVYRPGDTVHLASIVRGVNAALPPAFPYFLTVYDTKGKKFISYRMTTEGSNIAAVDFPVPDYVPTGRYSVAAVIGEDLEIGRADFQVEDFIPDKIRVNLTMPKEAYHAGDTLRAEVDAKMLFGPPASNYQLSGRITIEPQAFKPKGFSQYSFSGPDRSYQQIAMAFNDTLLDDTGGAVYTYQIPDKIATASALKGLIQVVVSEPGGRGVAGFGEVMIHPFNRYIGIAMAEDGYSKPGQATVTKLVAVAVDGSPTSIDSCRVMFNRVVYNTMLKKDNTGYYRWVSERKLVKLDSARLSIPISGATVTFTPPDYGNFEITAYDGQQHAATVDFYASGWGYAPWALTNPDRIELAFDKKSYAIGDKAKLQVRAPFGGKLTLTLDRTEVLEVIVRDIVDNTAEIEIPVKREFQPNIYVSATIVRPADSLEPNMPARAFGMAPLVVSTDDKKLSISVNAPEIARPNQKVTIAVQTDRGKGTELTLAAVDVGILQLTDFKTPDPLKFFHGKKQPRLKAYDLYSLVFPHVERAKNHLSPSGDRMFAAARMRQLNPISVRRVKSVALWSGVVKTDDSGKAVVTLNLPEFNGRLLIMAVGSRGEIMGSASKEMIVRDQIVLQEYFPRFMSPNDIFDGLITVFNNTGQDADIAVKLAAEGPVEQIGSTSQLVTVPNNRQGQASFRLRAKQALAKASFVVTAVAGEDSSRLSIELANRPAIGIVTEYGAGVVKLGEAAEFTLPGNWLASTEQYVIQTSGFPANNLARNVRYLLQYPYGCLEQTVSRCLPLLYYNDLIKSVDPAMLGGNGAEYFVQEGLIKVLSMRQPDGTFSFWPDWFHPNHWTSVYASHFISEASLAGFVIDKETLEDVYKNLKTIAQGKNAIGYDMSQRIYAALVLAEAGKLDQGTIGALKQVQPNNLAPYSRYQLAAALALTGTTADATAFLPAAVQPDIFEPETGGNFNSGVRTDAILLEALMVATPGSPSIEAVAFSLMQRANAGDWYTTQENAFGLRALGKYFRTSKHADFTGTLATETGLKYGVDTSGFKIMRNDLGNKKITVTVNSGEGSCFYFWQASGIPLSNMAPEYDRRLRVRRTYLTEDATPVDLTKVKIGDRVIAQVTIDATEISVANVVINDMLPAGFEIENPRLQTTPRMAWIPKDSAPITHQDIRDDRVLIFTDLRHGQTVKYYYSLRAISTGEFKVPPVTAECMYNPLIASSASSGAVTISR